MNIILIGFMGVGKSTIAKLLEKNGRFKSIDMDALIVKKSGRQSDTEIFDNDGEIYFRELEIAVSKELHDKDNLVIATGGGIVINKITIDYLKKNGKIIYLKSSFATSKKRVGKKVRPLFRDEEKAKQLFDFRMPLYTNYADIIVETDSKSPATVAEEIMRKIQI